MCDSCERQVTAKDGSSSTETYRCNCAIEYSYTKGWRARRVPSAMFDQPGAHHNPQRDPYPSETLVAPDARVVAEAALSARLDPSLLREVRAPSRRVEWTARGAATPPRRRWFGGKDRTRYEPLAALRGAERADAAAAHGFAYVGDGGWFFSPHAPSAREQLLKGFVMGVEGSLLDWQLGDLMPSCTAGDLRVRFENQNPSTVSVIAEVAAASEDGIARLVPRATVAGHAVGLVHKGNRSPGAMIATEVSLSNARGPYNGYS